MDIPVQITFRHMDPSSAIEAELHEKVNKLKHFYDSIVSCRVVIEAPHRHHHTGRVYHVSIELLVPGGQIIVNKEPEMNHAHEDVYVAIRDAFDAAKRGLEDYAQKQRQEVKRHANAGWE